MVENDLVEKALERWKNCIPDGYLTQGKMMTGDVFVDLAQKYDCFSSEKSILELGPNQQEWVESKSQRIQSPWKKGHDTYVAKYTKKEIISILERLSLKLLSFDKIEHENGFGEQLVVVAKLI